MWCVLLKIEISDQKDPAIAVEIKMPSVEISIAPYRPNFKPNMYVKMDVNNGIKMIDIIILIKNPGVIV